MTLKEEVVIHWKRMRDDAPGCLLRGEEPYVSSCPYCKHYFTEEYDIPNCDGCPIFKQTKRILCKLTPYNAAGSLWIKYKESGWNERYKQAWQEEADTMITFLEALPNE